MHAASCDHDVLVFNGKLNMFCCRISVCASIYLIIAVGVERYLAVCRPHHYREIQGRSNRVIMYLLPALLASLAINVTKFFEVKTVEYCVDFTHCGCEVVFE